MHLSSEIYSAELVEVEFQKMTVAKCDNDPLVFERSKTNFIVSVASKQSKRLLVLGDRHA